MHAIAHIVLSSLAVFMTASVLRGVAVDSFATVLIVAVILGVLNVVVRPILVVLTLPINVATLGLFTLVIQGFVVEIAAKVVPGFHVRNFLWAVCFGIVLAVINSFLFGYEHRRHA
ncbi:MAG: phage holin family protein [Elusimicrobia bacterium]|nr:phage holin family protein [Elusimicrobiota bacterium]